MDLLFTILKINKEAGGWHAYCTTNIYSFLMNLVWDSVQEQAINIPVSYAVHGVWYSAQSNTQDGEKLWK
jgi:hypothetical protein